MKLTRYKTIFIFTLLSLFSSLAFAQTERDKGIELYQKGDYQNAIDYLQKVVITDEKDQDAWLFLGMSFARLKKEEQAIKAFKKADKYSVKELQGKDINVKIISTPRSRYTDLARQNFVTGETKLAVEFGWDGKIKAVVAFKKLPMGLTENAVNAARGIKFEPATKNGKPITAIKIITNTFSIH
jgi:tetratricopeptide (TPR) repeat protein